MNYQLVFKNIDFEKIIDHPNILVAAHFWDEERYRAAKVCYKFMRAIDDLVDNYKSEHSELIPADQTVLEADVTAWISKVMKAGNDNPADAELTETIRKFQIPSWPLEAFARSMVYDIYHDGFASLQAFLDYASGASVAPASIFVHLCGLTKTAGGYVAPAFDVKEAATPCAVFSYLVHIIRDFVKDHTHNLNYFPDDLMQKYGLTRQNLLAMAQGTEITLEFREMIREIYTLAAEYREKTFATKEAIKPFLEERSKLSLEIIFALYDMVFERIDVNNGNFSTAELNPTPEEIKDKVWKVIERFERFETCK